MRIWLALTTRVQARRAQMTDRSAGREALAHQASTGRRQRDPTPRTWGQRMVRIMPIEKREQVFVSSTYLDLQDERQEVIQTLLEADCIPSGMEMFPASDDDRWTLIKRVIDDCDYYLVVVGGRYGSVDPEQEISYTQLEFDYAVSRDKPVMGFLHRDPGSIPAGKTDLDDAARKKLDVFREMVSQRVVKYWDSPESLGGQVAKSLIQIRKTHPAEGWVRARNALTPEVERELAELRARIAELTSELAAEHRLQVLEDTSDLASGEDRCDITAIIEYWTPEVVAAGETYERNKKRASGEFETTWNRVFARLAPELMDEASEEYLVEVLGELALELAKEEFETEEDPLGLIGGADIQLDSFNDVKVQLSALGLIERSGRRRAVSDTNTYWALTSRGQDQLMRLRAIRKSELPGADDD